MFKTAAKYINFLLRHLLLVVGVFGAGWLTGYKVSSSISLASEITFSKDLGPTLVTSSGKDQPIVSYSAAGKQNTCLETAIPHFNFGFQQQVSAFQVPQVLFLVLVTKAIPLYAVRAPGVSFISRFFPVSIQPNAP